MSTILNALRKLEEERQEGSAGGVDDAEGIGAAVELDLQLGAQPAADGRAPRHRAVLMLASVLVAGLAGGAFTLLGLSYWESKPPATLVAEDSSPPAVAAPASIAKRADVGTAEPAVELPPRERPTEAQQVEETTVVVVADLLRSTREDEAKKVARPVQVAALADSLVAGAGAGSRAVVAVDTDVVVVTGDVASDVVTDVAVEAATDDPIRETAPDVSRDKVAQVAPIEEQRELANSTTRSAPTSRKTRAAASAPDPLAAVSVTGTVWHPRSERRSAEIEVIEGGGTRALKLREGQTLGALKVKRIGPTGVVFLHNGREIERKIGGE